MYICKAHPEPHPTAEDRLVWYGVQLRVSPGNASKSKLNQSFFFQSNQENQPESEMECNWWSRRVAIGIQSHSLSELRIKTGLTHRHLFLILSKESTEI